MPPGRQLDRCRPPRPPGGDPGSSTAASPATQRRIDVEPRRLAPAVDRHERPLPVGLAGERDRLTARRPRRAPCPGAAPRARDGRGPPPGRTPASRARPRQAPSGSRAGSPDPGRPPSRARRRSRSTASRAGPAGAASRAGAPPTSPARHGPRPRRVVAADQVVLDAVTAGSWSASRWTSRSPNAGPSSGLEEPPVVGLAVDRRLVEPAAAREPEDRQPERVVHQRVEPVAASATRATRSRSRRRGRHRA